MSRISILPFTIPVASYLTVALECRLLLTIFIPSEKRPIERDIGGNFLFARNKESVTLSAAEHERSGEKTVNEIREADVGSVPVITREHFYNEDRRRPSSPGGQKRDVPRSRSPLAPVVYPATFRPFGAGCGRGRT